MAVITAMILGLITAVYLKISRKMQEVEGAEVGQIPCLLIIVKQPPVRYQIHASHQNFLIGLKRAQKYVDYGKQRENCDGSLLSVLGTMKMTDLILVLTNGAPGGSTEVVMTYIFACPLSENQLILRAISPVSRRTALTIPDDRSDPGVDQRCAGRIHGSCYDLYFQIFLFLWG